jgi:hypothetical protein
MSISSYLGYRSMRTKNEGNWHVKTVMVYKAMCESDALNKQKEEDTAR